MHWSEANMGETRKESQTTGLEEENQTSIARENQTRINSEKSQASSLENQTIATYTDDKLVSFSNNVVSKNTKTTSTSTSVCHLQSHFKEKHGKQINLVAISKEEALQLFKHFFQEKRKITKKNLTIKHCVKTYLNF